MKSSVSYAVMSSICALIVGLLLILWPDVAVNYLVITIGVFVFVAGHLWIVFLFCAGQETGAGQPACVISGDCIGKYSSGIMAGHHA